MGRNQRDEPINVWSTTNVTTDPSIDANVNDVLVIGDGLCTLIDELAANGVITK